MAVPSAKLLALLDVAADLRAIGKTWETIAQAVGRRPETCRRWPLLYRATWLRCLRSAARLRDLEAGGEAREFLRIILRYKDPKVAVAAARGLMGRPPSRKSAKAPPGQPDPELLAYISQIRDMSDEEAAQVLQRWLASRAD